MGIVAGVGLMVGGCCLLWLAWVASQRKLPPNGAAGIRTAWTGRSEEAWYTAHEAAAGPFGVGGATAVLGGLGVVVLGGSSTTATIVGGIGLGGLLGGVVVGTVMARRAVDRLDAP